MKNMFLRLLCLVVVPLLAGKSLAAKIECQDERKAIAASGGKARRVSEAVLEVQINGTKKVFTSQVNTDENYPDTRRYCGRAGNYVLIEAVGGGTFSGLLYDDRTGEEIVGGSTVVFSDDYKFYYAISHSDGMDGQNLRIHSIDGKLLWESYDSILADTATLSSYASLTDIYWTPKNTLRAVATCGSHLYKSWNVTLQKNNDTYQWTPLRKCQQLNN